VLLSGQPIQLPVTRTHAFDDRRAGAARARIDGGRWPPAPTLPTSTSILVGAVAASATSPRRPMRELPLGAAAPLASSRIGPAAAPVGHYLSASARFLGAACAASLSPRANVHRVPAGRQHPVVEAPLSERRAMLPTTLFESERRLDAFHPHGGASGFPSEVLSLPQTGSRHKAFDPRLMNSPPKARGRGAPSALKPAASPRR
jgi:hypothetical protein